MFNSPKPASGFPIIRRLWKPAVVTGAGGTTLVIWFEEIMTYSLEIVSVILVALMGGLICLFDHFVFKSRTPRSEDLQSLKDKQK